MFTAGNKTSSAVYVIEASVTALLIVPKLLAIIHNAQQVIAINKAEKVGLSLSITVVIPTP